MTHTHITMCGTLWCSDCKRTKKFLGEQRVHYEFINVDKAAEALALVEPINNGKYSIPTLIFVVRAADGSGYRAWAVLLALGSTYRLRGIPGGTDFIDARVHVCATCDGPFYRGRDVLVVGGDSAGSSPGGGRRSARANSKRFPKRCRSMWKLAGPAASTFATTQASVSD